MTTRELSGVWKRERENKKQLIDQWQKLLKKIKGFRILSKKSTQKFDIIEYPRQTRIQGLDPRYRNPELLIPGYQRKILEF